MRLVALLATFNEERFIAPCLEHLIRQGAEVFLIDNESTDGTVAIAEGFRGHGLIDILTVPQKPYFDHSGILAHKERLAAALHADWFLHVDADEFHMARRAGQTLAEALAEVDARGDNVVDFLELTFVPTQAEPDHDHPDFQQTMHWYYFSRPDYPFHMNAWKKQAGPLGLVESGGHTLQFPGLRLHPQPFYMRHYLCLSVQHAARKYGSRTYSRQEVRNGWHGWRPRLKAEAIRLPKQSELTRYDGNGEFDLSRPWSQDFLAGAVEKPADLYNRVVCVAGIHRSGTSMVVRLLNQCGLYLGPEDELIPPGLHNQEGYWENRSFVETNDAILTQLAGGWDMPPVLTDGWDLQPALLPMQVRAAGLVQRFAAHHPWGWKDPRTSLTWAFWKRLIPDLKLVICVRHPLEVAQSLNLRGYSSIAFGINLWLTYYQRLLTEVRPEDRLITHYESFFYDANAELRRLINWLHLCPSEADVERALAGISASQRHHSVGPSALLQAGVSDEVLRVYSALCAEAGLVDHCRPAPESEVSVLPQDHTLSPVQREFASALQLSHNAQLSAKTEAVGAHAQANQVLERQFAAAVKELEAIHGAKFWKVMTIYWRARFAILQPYRFFRQWLRNALPV